MKIFVLYVSFFLSCINTDEGFAGDNMNIFSTNGINEIDRCASIWLIKRHVNPNAIFMFFPKGEFIEQGTPFDTPDSQLRRIHNKSTFEVIAEKYGIDDQTVREVARIIHDIEIDFWGKVKTAETLKIERDFRAFRKEYKTNQSMLDKCMNYFDEYAK